MDDDEDCGQLEKMTRRVVGIFAFKLKRYCRHLFDEEKKHAVVDRP
jgi:hypothetical protein